MQWTHSHFLELNIKGETDHSCLENLTELKYKIFTSYCCSAFNTLSKKCSS